MPSGNDLPPLARLPVFGAAIASGAVLTAFSAGYGYDRDELYFRLLRVRWGYVDQGPLVPLIARVVRALVADTTWASRIPATLLAMLTTVVVALITREAGGTRGAQAFAAWAFAFAAFPVIIGHVMITATVDLLVWPAFVLFVMRAVLRRDGRWWLAAGVLAGVSTYNKLLIVSLVAALAVGVVIVGPRRMLLDRWLLAGTAAAVVVGLPNLLYQVADGWPELAIGRALSEHNGGSVRVQMWPFLLLTLGPPLVVVWVAGLVRLWRTRELRFVAAGFPVLLVIVFAMGSQLYYPSGLLSVLFGVGCVPTWQWLSTRAGWRRTLIALTVVNAAVSLVIGLPLIPVTSVGSTPIAGINQLVQDSTGWPTYVRQIARVYDQVPAAERSHTVVYASNYGEAGAVSRYGTAYHLPTVYSGHNQLSFERRPPASTTTIVIVGGQYSQAKSLFSTCVVRGHLDNGVGVDNEEQGEPIGICSGPRESWQVLWPKFHHLD